MDSVKEKLNSRYAVAALITSPQGIPLVRDRKKPKPYYWKLPGGRSEGKETPSETIIREIKEEIGLSFAPKDIKLVCEEERENHIFCLFQANPISLEGLKKIGNDEEEVKLFLPEQLKNLTDFFSPHRKILEEIKYFEAIKA